VNIIVDMNDPYPFDPPIIHIDAPQGSKYSIFDYSKLRFDDFMLEHWNPSIKVGDILERAFEFVKQNQTNEVECPMSALMQAVQD